MIDIAVLRGSTVRDTDGTRGEVLEVSLPWVRLGWWDDDSYVPRHEVLRRSDSRLEAVEILSITEGWVPAAGLLGARSRTIHSRATLPLSERLVDLVKSLEEGANKKKMSPYKRLGSIGPAVRGDPTKDRVDDWDCDTKSKYRYVCTNTETGRKKPIKVKTSWKKPYNKEYKKWLSDTGQRSKKKGGKGSKK